MQRPGQRGHGRGPRLAGERTSTGPSSPGSTSTTPTPPTSLPSRSSRGSAAGGPPASTTARSRSPTRRWAGSSRWLRDSGLDRKTVLVIIGDHGEGARAATARGPTATSSTTTPCTCRSSSSTPFEELRGVRVDSQVSSVDVFPTVLGLCGHRRRRPKVQGRSLLPLDAPTRAPGESYAYSESMTPEPPVRLERPAQPALDAVQADRGAPPGALRPRRRTRARRRTSSTATRPWPSRLKARLDRLMAETGRDAPAPESADLDKETLERLAALGYVGRAGRGRRRRSGTAPLADPKDKLRVFTARPAGGRDDREGRVRRGREGRWSRRCARSPKMPQALLMLGAAYAELGRTQEAQGPVRPGAEGRPEERPGPRRDGQPSDEGGQDRRGHRPVQADALARRAQHPGLRAPRRGVHRPGSPTEALPYLEKAVEIQPKLTQNRLNLAGCLIEVKQLRAGRGAAEGDRPATTRGSRSPSSTWASSTTSRAGSRRRGPLTRPRSPPIPGHFKARFNLGKVLFQLGRRAAALDEMREVVKLAPACRRATCSRPVACSRRRHRSTRSRPSSRRGSPWPRRPDMKALGWLLLADVYNRRHQPEKVNEALQQADSYVPATRRRESAMRIRQPSDVGPPSSLAIAPPRRPRPRPSTASTTSGEGSSTRRRSPSPDVESRLLDASTSRSYQIKTDKKGEFKFAGLPHAVYEVTFTWEGYVTKKDEWKFEAPQDTMQKVEVPDVVLVSQAQVAGGQAAEGCRGRGQGGRREASGAGDLDGAIVRPREGPRDEPEGRRTPSSTSGWPTPERRCTRRPWRPLPGSRSSPRVPRRLASARRLLPGSSATREGARGLREEPRARPRQRGRLLQLGPDPLRDEPDRRGARPLRAGARREADDAGLLEMAGPLLHPRREVRARAGAPREGAGRDRPTPPSAALLDELVRQTKALVR